MARDDRPHLFGFTPERLHAWLQSEGHTVPLKPLRAILAHLISEGGAGLQTRRGVPRAIRALLEERTRRTPLTVVEAVEDATDGSVKYLFRHEDGALSEAVRIPLAQPGRYTVCLSSQVGCAMGCTFCATGRLGLKRHLASWEIVAAFCAVRDRAPGRISGAVFMGQGEPLHNYDAVLDAASILQHPCGGRIAAEAITVSTVGLVPAIRRWAEERRPYRLIVSLTSARPELRRQLLPVAGRWSLAELRAALELVLARCPMSRLTLAWVLLGGVNSDPAEVDAIQQAFGGLPLRINLIDVNDSREDGFRRATREELEGFRDALQALRCPVVRRYSVGRSSDAACGMLAARHQTVTEGASKLPVVMSNGG